MACVSLRGIALEDSSGEAIRGLRIHLGRTSGGRFVRLADASCWPDGSFTVAVDFSAFPNETAFEIRAYRRGTRFEVSRGKTSFTAETAPKRIRLRIRVPQEDAPDAPTEPATSYSVRGTLTHIDGTVISGATIAAFHRKVNGYRALEKADSSAATTTTDSSGEYTLSYEDPTTYSPALTTPLRLVVTATTANGKVAECEPIPVPDDHVIVHLVSEDGAEAGDSIYAQLNDVLPDHLDGVAYANVDAEGVTILADATGYDEQRIQHFVDSQNLQLQSAPPAAPPAAIFALLRAGLPSDLDRITATPASVLEDLMQRAADCNEVGSDIATNAATYAANLREDAEHRSLADLGPLPLGSLLAEVPGPMSSADQRKFVRLRLDQTGPMEDFWSDIAADVDLDVYVTDLRRMHDVADMTLFNAEMLQAIDGLSSSDTGKQIAGYSATEWGAVLDYVIDGVQVPTIPSEIPGTGTVQRDNYIAHMQKQGELLYPSAVTSRRLVDRINNPSDVLQAFLEANPDHDFKARVTDAMVSAVPSGDQAEAKERLRRQRRLYAISPRTAREATMNALQSAGMDSAWAVRRKGKRALDALVGTIGQEEADEVWARARLNNAFNTNLLASVLLGKSNPNSVPPLDPDDLTSDPDFAAIFDTGSYCACKHCRSILSPAAYLVDLLDWLDQREDSGTTFLTVLDGRRPDIRHLKLSCENTNTPVPYVDLVLEVLENAVYARDSSFVAIDTTDVSAEELAANPAYVNEPAYTTLAAATFPPTAPFDFFAAQVDVFLAHLGIDRSDLMSAYQTDVSSVLTPTDTEIAANRLGMNATALDALTLGTATPDEVWALSGTWAATLAGDVPDVRARAMISRVELLEMMEVEYWNPGGIYALDDADPCDPDGCAITGSPDKAAFGQFMQFIRARRATGWTISELDKLISALGWTDLDGAAVEGLAQTEQLVDLTGRDIVDLASWWADIDTRTDDAHPDDPIPSLFDRIFLQDAIANLYGVDGSSTKDNPFGSLPGGAMSDDMEAIQAAMGVSEEDLQAAMDDVGPGLTLTLTELSAVYRRVSLARALDVTVPQAIALRHLQWRKPVLVDGYLGHAAVASFPGSPTTGDCVVATDAGTPAGSSDALAAGDVAEYDGSGWKLRVTNEAGVPPAGTRLLVSTTGTLLSPLSASADEGKIATFDGTSLTPTLETPRDNDLVKVVGMGAVNEGSVFEFTGTVYTGSWGAGASIMDPFAGPAQALAFVQFVAGLRDLDATIDEVLYLSHDSSSFADKVGPTEQWLQSTLGDLRDQLVEALTMVAVDDPDGVQLDDVMTNRVGLTPASAASVMSYLASGTTLDDQDTDLDVLDPYLDSGQREAFYLAEPQAPADRHKTVLYGLLLGFAKIEARTVVLQRFSAASGVAETNLDALRVPNLGALSTEDWTDALLADAFWSGADQGDWSDLTAASHPDAFTALELVVKLGRLAKAFAFGANEIAAWIDNPSDGLVEIQIADLMAPDRWVSSEAWDQTLGLLRFRDMLPGDAPQFHELWRVAFEGSGTDFFDSLEQRTGWSSADTVSIYTDFNWPLLRGRLLERLATCGTISDTLGVPLMTVQSWREIDVDAARADEVVEAVRGHYPDKTRWFTVAKSVRDPLRERQRAALVDYLVATDIDVEDAADLHAKYLIDVEMSPCMMTSRVKSALGSVQQFIQRGFLELEAGVVFEPPDREEWKWKKSYRVWEAARKIFLYPENWIEPELRDDKSDLFVEFETALGGGQLTSDHAEVAVAGFVDGIVDLGRLKVVTISHEEDVGTHYLARTAAKPFEWYYRFRDAAGNWTTWDRLPSQFSAEHASIGTLNGRVYLFWTEFRDGEDARSDVTVSWIERRDGRWAPMRSREFKGLIERRPLKYYTVRPSSQTGRILLTVTSAYEYMTAGASTAYVSLPSERQHLEYDFIADDVAITSVLSLGMDEMRPSNLEQQSDSYELQTDQLLLGFGGAPDGNPIADGVRSYLDLAGTGSELALDPDLSHFHVGPLVIRMADSRSYHCEGVETTYRFTTFDHPYGAEMAEAVRNEGIMGVLDPDPSSELARQAATETGTTHFSGYSPALLAAPHPVDEFDFDSSSSYGQYNWELFFHVPFSVASRLSADFNFEDAHNWYSVIFDPMNRDPSLMDPIERSWKVKPLASPPAAPVTAWAEFTGATGTDPDAVAAHNAYAAQVTAWTADPFNPHLIARMRSGTYQRALVMRYLDNLIAWADDLFARDSIESLNEATTLYLLALEILGNRREEVPAREATTPKSFDELQTDLDDLLNNPMVALEDYVDSLSDGVTWLGTDGGQIPDAAPVFYFCIPFNEKLLGYWDVVEDRLYKLRHCLDIEGRYRQLPLFQPPIDPALLVRAGALGIELSSVLAELETPLPGHRFSAMLGRAQALTGSIRSLGSALQQAIEKRDAEALAVLRSSLELDLQSQVSTVREQQLASARAQLRAARASLAEAEQRYNHYSRLLDKGDLRQEELQIERLGQAQKLERSAGQSSATAASLHAGGFFKIPDLTDPSPEWYFGPSLLAHGTEATGAGFRIRAGTLSYQANKASIIAGRVRRNQDWRLQKRQAAKQMETLERQILVSEIAVDIAESELENHRKQVSNLQEAHDFMTRKFTNEQLYAWQVSEISKLYFQTYQLAHDFARKAQRCYRHELADTDATFIYPGHFDSLRSGLLAGERLQFQLEQMDAAYMENDVRESELTKHFSLAKIDPLALAYVRETGSCYFELSEVFYELDVPGQYLRRLRGVSLTVPGVAGPYSTINARLTLHQSWIRDAPGNYTSAPTAESGPIESIVTSGRPDDTGLFQFDFGDPRYLPFERRGAVSLWRLELTGFDHASYDPDSIDDVVLTVRYTARDGGATAVSSATTFLNTDSTYENRPTYRTDTTAQTVLPAIGFSVRKAFPDAWYAMMNPGAVGDAALSLPLALSHFPRVHRENSTITITAIEIYLDHTLTTSPVGTGDVTILPSTTNGGTFTTSTDVADGWGFTSLSLSVGTVELSFDTSGSPPAVASGLRLASPNDHKFDPDVVRDMFIVVRYDLS